MDSINREKGMVYCSSCGVQHSKKLKKCPQCGKKITKAFYQKWWFWLLIIVVFAAISSSDEQTVQQEPVEIQTEQTAKKQSEQTTEKKTEIPVLSEEEYKALCESIAYVDIARNPGNYTGQKAYFRGKVIQVQESGKKVVLRIDVTQGEYGIWEDTVYVDYHRKSDDESRILEEDIVAVYGEIKGIKTYTAVLGNEISIPHLAAEYVELQ